MMQLECIISYMHKRYDLFDDDGQGMLPPAFHVSFFVFLFFSLAFTQ